MSPSRLRLPLPVLCLTALALAACGKVSPLGTEDSRVTASVTRSFQDGVSPSSSYSGTADTMLEEATPSALHGGETFLQVDDDYPDGTGKQADALLRFDLSSIPASSVVQAVTLRLNVTNPTAGSYTLYALNRSFVEGQASWTHSNSSTAWETAGARGGMDRSSNVLGTLALKSTGEATATLTARGVQAVQGWVKNPASNFGFLIDGSKNPDGLAFDSSEATTAAHRPLLAVSYVTGTTSTDAGTPPPAVVDAGVTASNDGGAPGWDGGATPIKYVLVLIKENHTFDNYFAGFPGATSSLTAKLSNGTTLTRPTAPSGMMPRDLCHEHGCAVTAFNGGAMNGFDKVSGAASANGTTDNLAFARFTEQQIPNYWQYARNFVLADHFFTTTLAPSGPGHNALTFGWNVTLNNASCTCGGGCTVQVYDPNTCAVSNVTPCWDAPSIVNELPAGFGWTEYVFQTQRALKSVYQTANVGTHFKSQDALLTDLTNGTQANLVFAHVEGNVSEHPVQAACPGENYSVQLINAAMNGPHWKETAIVLVWDDWGGWYDSVPPPASKCGSTYFAPGFRVPMMLISPYAKRGYVLKEQTEQGSVVRMIEDLWGLPRMQPKDARVRDQSVGSLMGAFDFTQAPRAPFLLTPRTCP